MKPLCLNMRFKGNRSYLHGSDFYSVTQHAIERLCDGWLTTIAFRKQTERQCYIAFKKPDNGSAVVATGKYRDNANNECSLWIMETNEPIRESYSFDEKELLRSSIINEKIISIDKGNGFSNIENIVALTKKINNHLSPDINGKWLFAQIDLERKIPDEFMPTRVIRKEDTANRFSRNKIELNGKVLGEIRFIVKKYD